LWKIYNLEPKLSTAIEYGHAVIAVHFPISYAALDISKKTHAVLLMICKFAHFYLHLKSMTKTIPIQHNSLYWSEKIGRISKLYLILKDDRQ